MRGGLGPLEADPATLYSSTHAAAQSGPGQAKPPATPARDSHAKRCPFGASPHDSSPYAGRSPADRMCAAGGGQKDSRRGAVSFGASSPDNSLYAGAVAREARRLRRPTVSRREAMSFRASSHDNSSYAGRSPADQIRAAGGGQKSSRRGAVSDGRCPARPLALGVVAHDRLGEGAGVPFFDSPAGAAGEE